MALPRVTSNEYQHRDRRKRAAKLREIARRAIRSNREGLEAKR